MSKKKGSLPLSFEKLLGKENCVEYQTDVFVPWIKQLYTTDEISEDELHHYVSIVQSRGLDSILPSVKTINKDTVNTTNPGGFLAKATLQLGEGGHHINHFVKGLSKKESLEYLIAVQKTFEKHLGASQSDRILVPIHLVNRKKNIILYQYMDGLVTLNDVLQQQPERKEEVLKIVIDDYVKLHKELNTPVMEKRGKHEFPYSDLRRDPSLHSSLMDFNTFFTKHYCSDKEFAKIFARDISDDLNEARKFVIHGDFHVYNILVNENPQPGDNIFPIDLAKAANNGFFEFDMVKLFTKAGASFDLEDRLSEYSARKLYTTEELVQESVSRHARNRITRELVVMKRYLNATTEKKIDESEKIKRHNNAIVLYNNALRRIDRAVSKGYLSQEFASLARKHAPSIDGLAVMELDEASYQELKQDFDPDISMTQENLSSSRSFSRDSDDVHPLETLEQLACKEKTKFYRNRFLRKAASIAAGILLGVGVPFVLTQNYFEKEDLQETVEWNTEKNEILDHYKTDFSFPFNKVMSSVNFYSSGEYGDPFEKYEEELLVFTNRKNPPGFDSLVSSYGFEPHFIKQVLEVVAFYGNREQNEYHTKTGILFLDPLFADKYDKDQYYFSVQSPRENIVSGLERLAKIRTELFGEKTELSAEENALMFYHFFTPEPRSIGMLGKSDLEQEVFEKAINYEIRRLAETCVRGLYHSSSPSATDYGPSMQWVPDDLSLYTQEDLKGFYFLIRSENPKQVQDTVVNSQNMNGKGIFFSHIRNYNGSGYKGTSYEFINERSPNMVEVNDNLKDGTPETFGLSSEPLGSPDGSE